MSGGCSLNESDGLSVCRWFGWAATRLSVRGMCTDQGSGERQLVDMPYVDDPALVAMAMEESAETGDRLSRCAEAFMFPRALWVSGPLHLVWNAFEAAIKESPGWEDIKTQLAHILQFLGHRGLRQRFVRTCLAGEPADVRSLFHSWRLVEEIFFCKQASSRQASTQASKQASTQAQQNKQHNTSKHTRKQAGKQASKHISKQASKQHQST